MRQGQNEGLDPRLADGLAELPAEHQARLTALAARFAALDPEEQAAVRVLAEHEFLRHQAEQVAEAVLDAVRRERIQALLPRLAEAAASFGQGHVPDSPYGQLARFIQAVAALLACEAAPPVPDAYREQFADLRQALGRAAGS